MAVPTITLAVPHVIKPSDTFISLAYRYKFSLDDFIEFNPNVDPDDLQEGQEILIPIR